MSFDILSRHLNIFSPHFLEASAGTGKTFAIEHLVARLLIEGENPCGIEQILLVTFTRAATRELKKRIRQNLWRIKEELIKNCPSFDYLKVISERGESAIKQALRRIEAALICYDTAQIYTLHGFCHRILNEFSFEARVGLEVSNPDEKHHMILLEQLIKDHLKEECAHSEYSTFQVKAVLNLYRRDFRKMISGFIEVISNGKPIVLTPTFSQLLEAFSAEVKALPKVEKAHFKADIELLRPLYKKMNDQEIDLQIELLSEILSAKHCTHEQFNRLLKGEFFIGKMSPDQFKVRAKAPEFLYYPRLIEQLRHSLLPLIQKAKNPSLIFLRLARELKEKSINLLEKYEKFSPDDLLLKVEQALTIPSFVERVRQKYRAAVIDEFQDTDPIQWKIFQKLFVAHSETVYLVGDPKQSIYAFRNADVYTYLDAAKIMGPSARKHLDTNFRSTSALVEALNHLFCHAGKGWMTLPGNMKSLDVQPVKAGLAIQENEDPLTFFVVVGKGGKSKKFPSQEMMQKRIFPYITSEIQSLHEKKGVAYHEIAILVKDRYQAQEVIDYLKCCGISANTRRGISIVDSPVYGAIKEVFLAVFSPQDMSKLKAVLGGVLFKWNATSLCKGLEDPLLLRAKSQFQMLTHVLFEKGVSAFFDSLLSSEWTSSSSSLLEDILRRGDLSLYLDLRKLSELLIEEATTQGLKGRDFLSFLEKIALEAQHHEERLRVPPQEEEGSVTVMTMHMSKGLEFNAVFALGIASRHRPSDQITVKKEGHPLWTVFDEDDPACQHALEEYDAEKMRQLYVALTRAKKHLYVPLIIDEEQKAIEKGEASPVELFIARLVLNHAQSSNSNPSYTELYDAARHLNETRLKEVIESLSPHICYRLLKDEFVTPVIQRADSIKLTAFTPLAFPNDDIRLFSFTALARQEHSFIPSVARPSTEDLISPHGLPQGSETGHLLHLLLEKIFKQGLHHPLNEKAIAELIENECVFSVLERWIPVILPWMIELLSKKLTTFSLAEIPVCQLQQEMEFFFPVAGGMMKGFGDLFFEFDNKYYLLDWKSNYLGPSDSDYTQENMIQTMEQNDYFLQASIYASALKRFVKLFDNRPFSECFGGAFYYFIRGKTSYHFFPEDFLLKREME